MGGTGKRREIEEEVTEEEKDGIKEEHGYGDHHCSTLNPTAKKVIHDAISKGGYGEGVSRNSQILAYFRTVHKVDSSLE